jgi:hypothetical protein
MADKVEIEGREYISSKRASESTGYAQDYIGQLARRGLIDAKRIGGLWYVSQASLAGYKERSEAYKPEPRQSTTSAPTAPDTVVSLDGKDYISASRAAEITGYNQDYVGQLAREGRVLSRQIGSRWYVERTGIVGHKREKDALLASVQAEAVGLFRPSLEAQGLGAGHNPQLHEVKPYFTYTTEDGDLVPLSDADIQEEGALVERTGVPQAVRHRIPIHVLSGPENAPGEHSAPSRETLRRRWGGILSWVGVGVATVVIVITFGYMAVSNEGLYTRIVPDSGSAMVTQASDALSRLGDILEAWLASEISYYREP